MLRRCAALTEYVCNGGGESKGKRSSIYFLTLAKFSRSKKVGIAGYFKTDILRSTLNGS